VKRSIFLLISLVVVTSMMLAACGPTATTVAPATGVPPTAAPPTVTPELNGPIPFPEGGKSVTGGWTQEPDSIVPYYTQMSYAEWITQLTLAGLGEWDDQGNYVPELAAEVPSGANGGVSTDGLTITWKLKPNLKWSDGEPLTSADVKFTWESIMDPGNAAMQKGAYGNIASIDTPDDLTVVIHFSKLYPPWQTLFGDGPNTAGAILPKHILEGKTALENDPFIHWPTVSSGPFIITEWVPGDHMTLLPNPHFYNGRPILDRIQIRFIPTPEVALAALQTGDIDWYPDFSEGDIATVGALEPEIHLKVVPGSEFEHYLFNLGVKDGVKDANGVVIPGSQSPRDGPCPLKDVSVRKAILLGIDREAIVQALLEGQTTVPASLWPNSYWNNTSLVVQAYDPEGAKALLDEAGYTPGADGIRHGMCNGVDTKLSFAFYTTDKQLRVDIALAVQSDLNKIGIEFKPNHQPGGTFFGTYTDGGPMSTGQHDIAGYTTGFYPDPYPSTEDFLCRSIPNEANPGGTNWYQNCDPQLDVLFAAINASADPAVRKVAVDAVQQYMYDKVYFIPMYARANVYGYTDRFVPGAFGFLSNMDWNAEVWDVK
jgi:peptide/nickel transport system substrate-binding protein